VERKGERERERKKKVERRKTTTAFFFPSRQEISPSPGPLFSSPLFYIFLTLASLLYLGWMSFFIATT